MSGKYLLDTSALIYAIDRKLKLPKGHYAVSAIKIRRATSLKLPDSIISVTAMVGGYVLVTNDEKLQNRHIGEAMGLDALTEMGTDL